MKSLLDRLREDPFLAVRFAARGPDAGYGTWAAYAEEDAAQALDQLLLTQLGQATRDPVTRWSTAGDGMRVLALLLHDALVRGRFEAARESYADFLPGRLPAAQDGRATWKAGTCSSPGQPGVPADVPGAARADRRQPAVRCAAMPRTAPAGWPHPAG